MPRSYTYGDNGRTTSVSDNRGTTSMTYESGSNRLSSVTDPVTGTISYTYGVAGERRSETLPGMSVARTFAYQTPQGFGRETLLTKDDPNSGSLRPVSMTDEQGRKVAIDTMFGGQARSTKYNQSYDSSGNLLSYCEVDYNYDGVHYPAGTPYSHGWLKSLSTTYWWRTSASSATWNSRLLAQNDYTNDYTGQRTSNTISWTNPSTSSVMSREEDYGYDALNRLTSADYGDGETQSYSFDAMGNRATKGDTVTGSGTSSENYSYDCANRLTGGSAGGSSVFYTNDANGNTLTGGSRTNTWDSENRLVKCAKSGGATSESTYGSDGLRHRMLVTDASGAQTQTDYVIDGQNVVEEAVKHRTSATASWGTIETVSYLMGPQGPLYRLSSNATDPSWYVYDGLGSVVGEVSVTGTLTASEARDVYGISRSGTGSPTTRHGFYGGLGHQTDDETGLVYMRARYYDPNIGRFTSQDVGKQGSNWFTYCNSSPTSYTDRSGKEFDLCTTMGASSMEEAMEAVADELGIELEGEVESMSGVLNEDASFEVRFLEEDKGVGNGDWGYYKQKVTGPGNQFLKAWVRWNHEQMLYDLFINDPEGELFAGHASPYIE